MFTKMHMGPRCDKKKEGRFSRCIADGRLAAVDDDPIKQVGGPRGGDRSVLKPVLCYLY